MKYHWHLWMWISQINTFASVLHCVTNIKQLLCCGETINTYCCGKELWDGIFLLLSYCKRRSRVFSDDKMTEETLKLLLFLINERTRSVLIRHLWVVSISVIFVFTLVLVTSLLWLDLQNLSQTWIWNQEHVDPVSFWRSKVKGHVIVKAVTETQQRLLPCSYSSFTLLLLWSPRDSVSPTGSWLWLNIKVDPQQVELDSSGSVWKKNI